MNDKIHLVLVTGLSGAGKTTVMGILEDMEYRCIDNYPVMLLTQFGELLKTTESYSNIAMAVPLNDALEAIQVLKNMEWIHLTIVFLDCENNVLLTRYKFTRRVHPLLISNKAHSLEEAIEFERDIAQPIALNAHIVIDTTHLKKPKLQERLENFFSKNELEPFRISFVSFGYKHGIPRDADLLFDVRFLPNPYYIEELRPLTGNDKEVYDYVIEKPETIEFIEKLTALFDYLFEKFLQEGKMHVVVGIGCTGGQHRSVTLTNYFADYYSKKYQVHRLHRDALH